MKCEICQTRAYSNRCVRHKVRTPIAVTKPLPRPTKRIKQQSDKEKQYQVWKETVARPYLIERDGDKCACCKRSADSNENLDIDHVIGKGAHRELKQVLSNLQLLCRWPCHVDKTRGVPCTHASY